MKLPTWLKPQFVAVSLLYSLFPIMFFYSENIQELTLDVLILPLSIAFLTNLIAAIVLGYLYKNGAKVMFILSFFWLWFFLYGRFQDIAAEYLPKLVSGNIFFGVVWVLILPMVLKVARNLDDKKMSQFVRPLAATGLALVLIQLPTIIFFTKSGSGELPFSYLEQNQDMKLSPKGDLPNIYYILPDAYPSSDTLEQFFSFSNQDFDSSLESSGFYVVRKSKANYYHTVLSVPATLNMSYLKPDSQVGGILDSALLDLYKEGKVVNSLQQAGYAFVNNSNLYSALQNPSADYNLGCGRNDDFAAELARTSVLRHVWFVSELERSSKRRATLCTIENIPGNAANKNPRFVFTHLMLPHPPYMFGENGEDVQSENLSLNSRTQWSAKEPFLNQLKYLNKQLLKAVNQILEHSPNSIIVIQSDHGTFSAATKTTPVRDKRPVVFRERTSTYTAIHLPDYCDKKDLYETMSNVNTFRVIFNSCFGTDYDILEDRTFYVDPPETIRGDRVHKVFEEITAIVNAPSNR